MALNKHQVNQNISKSMSEVATDVEKQKLSEKDKQNLRSAIISELDAINLYEQMANTTENEMIKKIMLDIAQEEKVHIGEFQKILDSVDPEQMYSSIEGEEEVDDILGGGNK